MLFLGDDRDEVSALDISPVTVDEGDLGGEVQGLPRLHVDHFDAAGAAQRLVEQELVLCCGAHVDEA